MMSLISTMVFEPPEQKVEEKRCPKNEVIAPMGRIRGEIISLAKVSAKMSRSAPAIAEQGIR
jgi:hypothetical protein